MTFTSLLADLRDAWSAVSFARPAWLALLALLPLLAWFGRRAARRKAQTLRDVGQSTALYTLHTLGVWGRGYSTFAYPLGVVLLVLAVAGPRWGKSDEGGIAVGRDLVIVIDLSRSMLAMDMNGPDAARVDAARTAALDLLNSVSRRGGHRVGVLVFAAKPVVLAPLTTDYDHIRSVLESLDGKHPPLAARPGPDPNALSGTRIGAALTEAVRMHDPRFPGSQDIVLLTDGDDPINDNEWRRGAVAARDAKIPVHVVGLGNPETGSTIVIGESILDFIPADGGVPETVRTMLHEEPLQAIATETNGQYIPARQDPPALGELYRTRIEPHPSREFHEEDFPQPREQYAWFLAAALLLFTGHWLRGE